MGRVPQRVSTDEGAALHAGVNESCIDDEDTARQPDDDALRERASRTVDVMLTELQKRAAQAIVNVFETGSPRGDYGMVTLLPGDPGHLTYGRSQTTLASGNLHLLILDYCETEGARLAVALRTYLGKLKMKDLSLDENLAFKALLKEAGDDPVMRAVQDEFFDDAYWTPSVRRAEEIGIVSALGSGVVYDSGVHGSWPVIRDRTTQRHGDARTIGEEMWIGAYVEERREWLADHANVLLRRTVYRMDAFEELITEAKWELPLPFSVRRVTIDEHVLLATDPIRVSAEDPLSRTLLLMTPRMKGNDVRALQDALIKAGVSVRADGVFGPTTDKAVKRFQQQEGLKVDGIAGPVTLSHLGL